MARITIGLLYMFCYLPTVKFLSMSSLHKALQGRDAIWLLNAAISGKISAMLKIMG